MFKQSIIITALLIAGTVQSTFAQDNITPQRKHAIDSLAIEKVRDLSKYISIIGDKATSFSEASRVIKRAEELFEPGSKLGVSSLESKDVNYFTVDKYFQRLMALNYLKVKIDWYNVHYISDLEKQPDGKYVGVVTIYQRFEGFGGEGLKYTDVTKKDVTIYVEKKQTQINGMTIDFWDVILGDIKVSETKKV